jgi:branched-chain amino acid transport system substrate-binding protein
MKQSLKLTGLAVLLGVAAASCSAGENQDRRITTCPARPPSRPAIARRPATRNRDLGGKMAGKDVEVVVVDDEPSPTAP